MALTRAKASQLRHADPAQLVRQLARAWSSRFSAWARYWLHHAPLRDTLTVATLSSYVRALATAPVDMRMDNHFVNVFRLPSQLLLHICVVIYTND